MKARVRRFNVGNAEYLQVVADIRTEEGRWTTKVLKSYGITSPDKLRLAEELVTDINRHEVEPDAPYLDFPARLRSLQEGPFLGILSPEITPRIWYGLIAAAEAFLRPLIRTENGLREAIALTQPDLKTENDRERFFKWVKDKPDEEKLRILVKRWYYPR